MHSSDPHSDWYCGFDQGGPTLLHARKGRILQRTGYAVSRLAITRTDAGHNTFNFSEIAGAGAAAAISNSYYPAASNVWVKTYQRWGKQLALGGVFNIFKVFWPDINKHLFHEKY